MPNKHQGRQSTSARSFAIPSKSPGGEVLFYRSPDGMVRLGVQLTNDTVWLSLPQMDALFERDKWLIPRHVRNVFQNGEVQREAVVAKNATVQHEGDREVVREIEYFNLDAILWVGYRVNSKRGLPF